jgi:hypothetical protein
MIETLRRVSSDEVVKREFRWLRATEGEDALSAAAFERADTAPFFAVERPEGSHPDGIEGGRRCRQAK